MGKYFNSLSTDEQTIISKCVSESLEDTLVCDTFWSAWDNGTMDRCNFYKSKDSPPIVGEATENIAKCLHDIIKNKKLKKWKEL